MLKGKFNIKKLNNSGSTLTMTLLAMAFVSLLASTLLAAAIGNIVMKRIDNSSKETFYTAESVLDEIKVGVGKDSMVAMADAYEEVLSSLIVTDGTVDYMLSNEEANEKLQELFMVGVTEKLTNGNVDFKSITTMYEDTTDITKQNVEAYLETYIAKEELKFADVKDIESVTFIKDYNGIKNEIIINNVVIDYKAEKATDTYFANVTVDLDIAYPNMMVDFSATKRLKEFKNYAFIADGNINVASSTQNANATINASIYAGGDILITSGSSGIGSLTVGPNYFSGGTTSDVVAGNNIVLMGSSETYGNKAKMSLSNSRLWCTNLNLAKNETVLKQDITAGAELTIGSDCSSFIADDLNVSGKNSLVNVGGEYYGYRYDGNAGTDLHTMSSAIIIDGAGSIVNLGGDATSLSKLVIGGHSYISYEVDGVDSYMTGESLSFTGNQELYLVPAKYIAVGREKSVANPMPKSVWEKLVEEAAVPENNIKLVDMTGFFAFDEGLLDATNPYEIRNVDDRTYVYFNFKDKDSAAKFIAGVLDGKDSELADKLDDYANALLSEDVTTSGAVKVTNGGSIYTAGVLMQTSGGGVSGITGEGYQWGINQAEFSLSSLDLTNRYKTISHLLVSFPFVENGSRYVIDGDIVTIDDALFKYQNGYVTDGSEFVRSATENIIDWELVKASGYNDEMPTKALESTLPYALTLTKVAIDDSYTIPSEITGGIIVATGDVIVNHDFTGLIVSKGNIRVTANAAVTTDLNLVEQLLTWEFNYLNETIDEEVAFRDYFWAYKRSAQGDGSEEVKIETLEYDDIVSLNNWRKYDDSAN